MAHQHVLLVQDEAFSLSSLRDRPVQRQNGSSSDNRRLLGKFTGFAHPRTGQRTKYLRVGDDLLELQAARPREPQGLGSFFIDQSVQEDGSVLMANRIDPLFLLLPVLSKHASKWCPLDQALAEAGCAELRGIRQLDANKLCDVNDRLGPDELLIRINEDMVMAWLTAKVKRATARFAELIEEGKDAQEGEGFASGFSAIAAADTDRPVEGDAECQQQALGAVCEYVGAEWAEKLAASFGTTRAPLFGGNTSAPKKRKGNWEESKEADRNLELSHGGGGGVKTKSDDFGASKAKKSMSQAQKNLTKVNKKGMKSIKSFFK